MRSEGYSSRFVCVCVFVCPTKILRMAALSIELSHVLCINSNYLQNRRVVCRKTLSFLRYCQSCSYNHFGLHGHAYNYLSCVYVCVCMYVCPLISAASHIESHNRDTNGFTAIQRTFKILPIFLKILHSKVMA